MAMAEVFIPSPHDSIPPLHQLPTSPPFPSPPPSTCSSYHEDQDHTQAMPPAPPPSPQGPVKVGPFFEIDASYFERPRKSELPPSPTNSLDFSAIFTPNKSPLESEPHSPVQPSPGDPLDSAYHSAHASTSSQHSNAGSSRSIPISPSPATGGTMFYSYSDDSTFRNGLRSQTSLAQHHDTHSGCHLSVEAASPAPRPRSHTHPSHTLTPHASLLQEQHRRQETLQALHPHLPLNFDATQLPAAPEGVATGILDSGYHEVLSADLPFRRSKFNLKRKSNELGYEGETMDLFSYDSFSESGCSGSESEWQVVHKSSSKKACQEGRNPIIRRQSSSFSGGFTYSSTLCLGNASAPSTPRHSTTTPQFQQAFPLPHVQDHRQPSLSPPVFPSPLHSPFTPTPSTDVPPSLQSMEVGGEGPLDSLDSLMDTEPSIEMDSLSCQLRVSHLEHVTRGNEAPPTHHAPHSVTLGLPQIPGGRSHSSGDSYDFGLSPQLAQGCGVFHSSYHESSQNILNETCTAENRFLLSKSL